MTEC